MKKTKLYLAMLMFATLFISFNACSSDDKDEKDDEEQHLIFGKWKRIVPHDDIDYYEFKPNGVFEWTTDDGELIEKGTYVVNKDILSTLIKGDWRHDGILHLSDTKLTLEELDDNKVSLGQKPDNFERVK